MVPSSAKPLSRNREDSLKLLSEARALNSKAFSLVRLELLSSLSSLAPEGATYREIKPILDVSDGLLFSNLNALIEMGYVKKQEVELEGRKLDVFKITGAGMEEWLRIRAWLKKFAGE